jgi:glutaredoxin
MEKQITIYSTPTCHFCKLTKDFLTEKGLTYTEYNVADDLEKRKEMVDKSGQMGVPVIVVKEGDKEEMMIGFEEKQLSTLLNI